MTTTNEQDAMRSNRDLIGRDQIGDLEAVLSVVGRQESDGRHLVDDPCPAEFTWDYEKGARPKLEKLYEKAKRAQWNGTTDLPWDTEVDQERVAAANREANGDALRWANTDLSGTVLEQLGRARVAPASGWRTRTGCSPSSCTASRARCCARPRSSRRCRGSTPSTTPPPRSWTRPATSRSSPATSTRSSPGHYPINAHLGLLLDDIMGDSRWDMTYLGMQIMVEGLALAAFGFIHAADHRAAAQAAAALRDGRRGPPRRLRGARACRSTTSD